MFGHTNPLLSVQIGFARPLSILGFGLDKVLSYSNLDLATFLKFYVASLLLLAKLKIIKSYFTLVLG